MVTPVSSAALVNGLLNSGTEASSTATNLELGSSNKINSNLGQAFLNNVLNLGKDLQASVINNVNTPELTTFDSQKMLKAQADLDEISNEIEVASKITGLVAKAINQLVTTQ